MVDCVAVSVSLLLRLSLLFLLMPLLLLLLPPLPPLPPLILLLTSLLMFRIGPKDHNNTGVDASSLPVGDGFSRIIILHDLSPSCHCSSPPAHARAQQTNQQGTLSETKQEKIPQWPRVSSRRFNRRRGADPRRGPAEEDRARGRQQTCARLAQGRVEEDEEEGGRGG